MKEQKIYDYVRTLGREPLEHGAIVVTRAPETIPLAVARFLTQSNRYRALVLCTDAIALVPLDEVWGIKKNSGCRIIALDDIHAAHAELADAGMTRRIIIDADDDELVLNAQHEETSALRTSGLWGSWHARNLPDVVARIEELGRKHARTTAEEVR